MTKPKQDPLFHVARVESASTREMLRRNGGIREVEGIRLWKGKSKRKTAPKAMPENDLSSLLPKLRRMS